MAQSKRPLISSTDPAWLRAIAIKGNREVFTVVGPAASLANSGARVVSFDNVTLEYPLAAYAASDPYPIPITEDREGYYGDLHYDWWLSGLYDYLAVKQTVERFGGNLKSGDAIFELGCASGRVLRHFACQARDLDLWAADINLRHVEWIRNFLPERIKIFQNTALPHLPVDDKSISLITAFSVFTHIDELELAWLAELRRVLKPGGFAYLTIHSERTWLKMAPGLPAFENLIAVRERIPDYVVSDDLFRSSMPAEKVVFSWEHAANYNSSVFHHSKYVRSVWGRFFEVRDILEAAHNYQDVVILRRNV
jgi:ubiquinone/menaquinone biosynthesis C-methylase UbiE